MEPFWCSSCCCCPRPRGRGGSVSYEDYSILLLLPQAEGCGGCWEGSVSYEDYSRDRDFIRP